MKFSSTGRKKCLQEPTQIKGAILYSTSHELNSTSLTYILPRYINDHLETVFYVKLAEIIFLEPIFVILLQEA